MGEFAESTDGIMHSTKTALHRSRLPDFVVAGISAVQFRQRLWRYRMTRSMNRRGNCWDNTPMERVIQKLEIRLIYCPELVDHYSQPDRGIIRVTIPRRIRRTLLILLEEI
ncbi:hypothetical protein QPK13_12465 [Photorhabdus tasmaniensis]